MMEVRNLLGAVKGFLRNDSGVGTVFGLFLMAAVLMMSGLALDSASGRMVRNQMQIAVDASALAAAARLGDPEAARGAALALARLNLGEDNMQAITESDVVFGIYDLASGAFVEGEEGANAVKVFAHRNHARDNSVKTYLMQFVGIDAFDVTTVSLAVESNAPLGKTAAVCEDALILTTGSVNAGSDNTLDGRVCLHGQQGVTTGGNDLITAAARVSAPQAEDILLGSLREGSAPPARIKMERTLEPTLLPEVGGMIDSLWSSLWVDDLAEAARADLAADATTEHSLVPSFIRSQGVADVVIVDRDIWTVDAGDLEPNTVYLASHDVVLRGGVQARDLMILAQGSITSPANASLSFRDVVLMAGGEVAFSGQTTWGQAEGYCDLRRYNSYALSASRVTLSGLGGASAAHGLVVAAPEFVPGTALRAAGGIYVETLSDVALGGDMVIGGCDMLLASAYPITRPQAQLLSNGSYLVQ